MNHGANLMILQMIHQFLPVRRYMNDKLVPGRIRPFPHPGQDQVRIFEFVQIPRCQPAAFCVQVIQILELDAKQPRLNLIQPTIGAHHLVMIVDTAAIIPEHFEIFCQLFIIGRNTAAIPECTAALGGIKAETADVSYGADFPSLPVIPMALRTVFNDSQMVVMRNGHDLIHITGLSKEMHRQNRLGRRRNCCLYLVCIDVVIRIRLYKNRLRSVHGNAHHTGNIGIGADNHLVPFSDSQQAKGNP